MSSNDPVSECCLSWEYCFLLLPTSCAVRAGASYHVLLRDELIVDVVFGNVFPRGMSYSCLKNINLCPLEGTRHADGEM
jgi:hypothetical protein